MTIKDEMAKNTLWDRFRKEYGPRPGGVGAQKRWEAEWQRFKEENK